MRQRRGISVFGTAAAWADQVGFLLRAANLHLPVPGGSPVIPSYPAALLTSALSRVVSNTATAVRMAPIALAAPQTLPLGPYAFVMPVAMAASLMWPRRSAPW